VIKKDGKKTRVIVVWLAKIVDVIRTVDSQQSLVRTRREQLRLASIATSREKNNCGQVKLDARSD
jgi:hypothetical protein